MSSWRAYTRLTCPASGIWRARDNLCTPPIRQGWTSEFASNTSARWHRYDCLLRKEVWSYEVHVYQYILTVYRYFGVHQNLQVKLCWQLARSGSWQFAASGVETFMISQVSWDVRQCQYYFSTLRLDCALEAGFIFLLNVSQRLRWAFFNGIFFKEKWSGVCFVLHIVSPGLFCFCVSCFLRKLNWGTNSLRNELSSRMRCKYFEIEAQLSSQSNCTCRFDLRCVLVLDVLKDCQQNKVLL